MNPPNVKLQKTSSAQIAEICGDLFGITGESKSLASERDETILIRGSGGQNYILKISHPDERPEVLRFQTRALLHLAGKPRSVPLPQVVFTQDGSDMPLVQIGGHGRLVRMLTYLEGMPLYLAPHSRARMTALGQALAELGLALSDYDARPPKQDLLWNLVEAGRLRDRLPGVGAERQALVSAALDGFDAFGAKAHAALPAQVIHNDFNPHNILVSPENTDRLAGVIDFGDLIHAPLVCDLAVALSYHVCAEPELAALLAMLHAFHQRRPLSRPEIEALPCLLRMRLAMSLLISEWSAAQKPENASYLLRNHPTCLSGLQALQGKTDAELAEIFASSLK